MFNAVSGSQPISSPASFSPCCVGITEQTVIDAVGAIISRMIPTYCELMREAKERPEIISDHSSYLHAYYAGQSITSEMRSSLEEAEKMAPNWKAVTKTHSDNRISVFSENNEFDETQTLKDTRFYIKLRVNTEDVKNVQEQDQLDNLLSHLSKKIFSLGYGEEGTFDIRLEKGYLPLEANPWKWHFDGIFKTSITVCYSNKKNWSTRVWDPTMGSDGKPADHDFLYDALNIYHRAPIPSDLEGNELQADDYRLFIRYNEFYKSDERVIPHRAAPEEDKSTLNLNPFGDMDAIPKRKTTDLETFLIKEQSVPSILSSSRLLTSQYTDPLVNAEFIKSNSVSNLIERTSAGQLENLRTSLFSMQVPEYDFSVLLGESKTNIEVDFNAIVLPTLQAQIDDDLPMISTMGHSYEDNACCTCTMM